MYQIKLLMLLFSIFNLIEMEYFIYTSFHVNWIPKIGMGKLLFDIVLILILIVFLSSANSEHSHSADLKLDHVCCSNFFDMFHADNFFMAAFNPMMILFSPLYIVYICQRS